MATVSNLPAMLQDAGAAPFAPGDELLSTDELKSLSIFHSGEFTKVKIETFPGSTILRKCPPGRVLCQQGDNSSSTAFYLLTSEDVHQLRAAQRKSLDAERARRGAIVGRMLTPESDEPDPGHVWLRAMDADELDTRETALDSQIAVWSARVAEVQAAEAACDLALAPLLAERKRAVEASDDAGLEALLPRIAELEQRKVALRRAARVELHVPPKAGPSQGGLLSRLVASLGFGKKRAARDSDKRTYISADDAPVEVPRDTGVDWLNEGEICGEMSCMNRRARSATVVAERGGYALEILRNVLDLLHKDAAHRRRRDEIYETRVLRLHVRRFSIFEDLTDAEFEYLRPRLELKHFQPGDVLCEEHEASDDMFVIRDGLVKVMSNASCRLRRDEMDASHWSHLARELTELPLDADGFGARIWAALPDALKSWAQSSVGAALDDAAKDGALALINQFITAGKLHTTGFDDRDELRDATADATLRDLCENFAADTRIWSQFDAWTFHRMALERFCPAGFPQRYRRSPVRTIAYRGRGEPIGEIGVVRGQPRSATCVAYDHPWTHRRKEASGSLGAVTSRLEVIRIPGDAVHELKRRSDRFAKNLERFIEERVSPGKAAAKSAGTASMLNLFSDEADRLGLVEGQKLMVIDLDRCTRCGACVDACVHAHDDGKSRLFLDGPRHDRFLIPQTCRQCLDPVCMIGCPVGSINRGENGQIEIENWCIGCTTCANQCPYGSIQMHPLPEKRELTAEERRMTEGASVEIKSVDRIAVVCDLCSQLPGREPACVYSCPHDAALRVDASKAGAAETSSVWATPMAGAS